jgi:hypothetical protein
MIDIHQKGSMFLRKVGFPMSTYLKDVYFKNNGGKRNTFHRSYRTPLAPQ